MGPNLVTKREQMMTAVGDIDITSSYDGSIDEQCVEETPKCRSKKRMQQESTDDKENIPDGESTVTCAEKEVSKPPAKRMLLDRDITVKKNSKSKATVKARSNKKQIALLQGQRQLTSFFR